MPREVGLKISEVLGYGHMSQVFPLGNIREFRDHLDHDFPFLFMLHLDRDGLIVSGPKVLDEEVPYWPGNTPTMPACPGGTLDAVLLQG